VKDKLYFHNLNGLRFIAASFVIVCHIELTKRYYGVDNFRNETKFLGELGVDLFFVLSGFLITFLLLKEKERFLKINYKSFYIRRILRIWPLYYIIVMLSLFVLPNFEIFNMPISESKLDSTSDLVYVLVFFVLMLPNVLFLVKPIPFAAQTWSIGTEEQFYLIWPLVISKTKNYKTVFVSVVLLYWLLYFIFKLSFFDNFRFIEILRNFYSLFKIDVLTIGSLAAILLYEKNTILVKIINSGVFIISLLLLSYFYLNGNLFVERVVYSVLFALLILNFVALKSLSNVLEFKWINYLGKISYGIYMYHLILIVVVMNVLIKFNCLNDILLYTISFLLTILVSAFSYEYIEKPFLKLKLKYSYFEIKE